jgi:Domain of unknown function (DUF1917)
MDYQRDERRPSQVADNNWIIALRGHAMSSYETNGKWLIHAQKEKIDNIWNIIALATEEGCLGSFSKVSTSALAFTARTDVHVICIYTYSSGDYDDVMRVRAMLRELGMTSSIPYVTWTGTGQEQTTLYTA